MSREGQQELRFFIPTNIYNVMVKCITVKFGDQEIQIERTNQFAREMFYIGLRVYLETPSISLKSVSGTEVAKAGAEVSQNKKED